MEKRFFRLAFKALRPAQNMVVEVGQVALLAACHDKAVLRVNRQAVVAAGVVDLVAVAAVTIHRQCSVMERFSMCRAAVKFMC